MNIQFKDIVELYQTGKYSLTELSREFKICRHHLSRKLKELNIPVVNKQNVSKFNENIFDSIDSEEKAYWLGFIFADGYVSNRDNAFELSLKLDDFEHLEKLKKFLEWSGTVKKDNFRCRLSVTNKHLKQILITYGCTPKKSLTLEFPNMNIFKSKNLIYPFIRGYFDGDGCLVINKNKSSSVFEIISTKNFLNSIQSNLNWKTNKLMHDKRHSEFTFLLRYAGKTALTVLDELYKDSKIHLDRKFLKYKKFAALYRNI